MIGIGRHTDYAARVILHLAALGDDGHVTVREIAEHRLLPPAFVRRIVARLAAAGLVTTIRGQRGGVRLGRPASRISLLDVIRAMEGGVTLSRCVDEPHTCPLAAFCPVQRAWTSATRELERHLGSVLFSDLARGPIPSIRTRARAARGPRATRGTKAPRAPAPRRATR
jgi:Rrf2 family protein